MGRVAYTLHIISLGILLAALNTNAVKSGGFKYPEVNRDENVTDDYHGTKISDPYRWLEDPDSNETKEFVKAQNNLTFSYLEEAPYRKEIRAKLTELWNYPKVGAPMKKGDKYYFYQNSGLQNQWVLMVQDSLESEARVFFDLNTLSEDGTVSSPNGVFSDDGNYFAYTVAKSGSDWVTIHIKNASTGKDLPEVLKPTKFTSISWSSDNLGFFYTRYPDSETDNKNETGTETDASGEAKIYYHKVGTDQKDDVLVLEFPDQPNLSIYVETSLDGNYLIIQTSEVINEDFYFVAPLKEAIESNFTKKLNLIPLHNISAGFTYVTNDESLFYFVTGIEALNLKLVRIDLNKPGEKYWSTVIPEANEVLEVVHPINNDMIFVSYKKDVKSVLELRHLQNGSLITEFDLGIGVIDSTSGNRNDTEFFFEFSTFTSPTIVYKIDMNGTDYKAEVYKAPKSKVNSSALQVEQVFYSSKDGTQIPMYILSRNDFEKNGQAPAYMYSYGGYIVSMSPSFSIEYVTFVNHFHGIVAIPSIRGGGEYGSQWWEDGRLLQKQNSFDDFAAAAEYLIKNNYTSASKLVINGASNGGLLVAATLNQRPELFGAAIPEVGVMDMLRFQKFTVGSSWCGEYGCSENKTYFDNLITYSPLHNIRLPKNESVQYPAVLVKTADHDDRVVPLHSYKYIAELQYKIGRSPRQNNPLLIRIEEKAGHGSGTPTSKKIEAAVDDFSFYARALNYTFYE